MKSHFTDGIQTAIDSTSLGLLKECPRKYYYTMIEDWRPHGESVHLTFGTLYHSALEHYDKFRAEGKDYEESVDATVQYTFEKTDGWLSDNPKKNRDTLLRTVIWYLEQFKDDPYQTIILDNGKPAVELSFKMESGIKSRTGEDYLLCGHLDRLVKYGEATYVMDRKTTGSTLGAYYFSEFNPHNQMSLYTLASKVIYGTKVSGVIIDAAQIAIGFSSFGRTITTRSEHQLDEFLGNVAAWLHLAEEFHDRNYWPMNEMSCHKYGGCPFREVCSKDPAVRQNYLETLFEKRVWNPLENRE